MSNFRPREAAISAEAARRKLDSLATLTTEESKLLLGLADQRQEYRPGAQIYGEDLSNNRAQVILSGWACHARSLSDGRNQIFRFLIPGDCIGLYGPAAGRATPTIIALTHVITADARVLSAANGEGGPTYAGLAAACARSAWLDDIALLDQIVRLGRQTALERMAHLLLEFHGRLERVGLTAGRRYSLPITQEILADALGLSVVHVNRTLQQLRREHLIEMRAGYVDLLQIDTLKSIADYRDPSMGPDAQAGAERRWIGDSLRKVS
jgi:CRP-like cAMP-binding protein